MLTFTNRRLALLSHLKRAVLLEQLLSPSLTATLSRLATGLQRASARRCFSGTASAREPRTGASARAVPVALPEERPSAQHPDAVFFDGIVVKIGGIAANAQQMATSITIQRALDGIRSSNPQVAAAAARALFQLLLSLKCKNALISATGACRLLVMAIRDHTEAGRHAAAAEVLLAACGVASLVPREAGYSSKGGLRNAEYIAAIGSSSFDEGCAALVSAGAVDATVQALLAAERATAQSAVSTEAGDCLAAAACRLLELFASVSFGAHHEALRSGGIAPALVAYLRICKVRDGHGGTINHHALPAARFALNAGVSLARIFTGSRPGRTSEQPAVTPMLAALVDGGALPAAAELTEAIASYTFTSGDAMAADMDRKSGMDRQRAKILRTQVDPAVRAGLYFTRHLLNATAPTDLHRVLAEGQLTSAAGAVLAANVAKPLDWATADLMRRALGLLDRQAYLKRLTSHGRGGPLGAKSATASSAVRGYALHGAVETSMLQPRFVIAGGPNTKKASVAELVVRTLDVCADAGIASKRVAPHRNPSGTEPLQFEDVDIAVQNAICDAARVLKHLAEPTQPCDMLLAAGAGRATVKALTAFDDHIEVAERMCDALRVMCFPRKDGPLDGNVLRARAACWAAPAIAKMLGHMKGSDGEAAAFDAAVTAAAEFVHVLNLPALRERAAAMLEPLDIAGANLSAVHAAAARLLHTPAGRKTLQHNGDSFLAKMKRGIDQLGVPVSASVRREQAPAASQLSLYRRR